MLTFETIYKNRICFFVISLANLWHRFFFNNIMEAFPRDNGTAFCWYQSDAKHAFKTSPSFIDCYNGGCTSGMNSYLYLFSINWWNEHGLTALCHCLRDMCRETSGGKKERREEECGELKRWRKNKKRSQALHFLNQGNYMWEQRDAKKLGFAYVLWCVCGEVCVFCWALLN